MGKEKYIIPETEIVEFEAEDVIVTSGESSEEDELFLLNAAPMMSIQDR